MCALVVPAAAETPKRPKTPPAKPAEKVADAPTPAPGPTTPPAPTPTPVKGGKEPPIVKKANGSKEQNFNLEGSNFSGKNRSPQLLYFLERANEELERASLEKRSFIPHLMRSLEQEAL